LLHHLLLDEVVALHQHQRQEGDAVLLGEVDLGDLGLCGKRQWRERSDDREGAEQHFRQDCLPPLVFSLGRACEDGIAGERVPAAIVAS
jgi:hypothetical protein